MKKSLAVLGLLLAVSATTVLAQGADGKAVYEANCKKCHGPAGTPSAAIKKMTPKIATFDAAFFANRADADLVKQITEGKDKMKAFGGVLKPDEIAAVAKYIRTLAK
jgi:mono/diheme cytochrome c family protein